MRLKAELAEAREAFFDAADVAAGAARVLAIQRSLDDRATASSTMLDGDAVILGPECDPPELCPPESLSIMSWDSHGAEQTQLYYCGPASARMAGLWKGVSHSQSWWWQYTQVYDYSKNPPKPLGYSSLPNIKNALNDEGGYDATADKFHITYFDSGQLSLYLATVMDRIWHDDDPAISSVYLLDDYFPYFSQDYSSGHFQVVRGYYLYVASTYDPHIRIFEPFNENRFWPTRPVTSGPQVVTDNQLYNATMAQPSNRIAAS
jgi:hypothetical protein